MNFNIISQEQREIEKMVTTTFKHDSMDLVPVGIRLKRVTRKPKKLEDYVCLLDGSTP